MKSIFSLLFVMCLGMFSFSQTVDVTFRVDMQYQNVSPNGVHLAGSMQGWSTSSTPLSNPNGDNIWEVTLTLNTGWYYEYKFINGNTWGSDEILASWEWCQNNGNRNLTANGTSSYSLDPYVFGSCNVVAVMGCTDPTAQNYNAQATNDDGSCIAFSCSTPTNLQLQSADDTKAWVEWDEVSTSVDSVNYYKILYREVGDTSWLIKQKNYDGNQSPLVRTRLQFLSPSSQYEMKIKAVYNSGCSSDFSPISYFNTLSECPNVINLAVTTPNSTRATFSWDTSGVYSFVRIKIRVDAASTNWVNVGGFGVPYGTLSKNKNGLVAGESYRAQARTWCNPNGGSYKSPSWSPLIFWTQPISSNRLSNGLILENLTVYPNPSKDNVNVSFTSEDVKDCEIKLFNNMGELVYFSKNKIVGEFTKQIELSNYSKGLYFFKITLGGEEFSRKVIVQ
tara:strand:+ start:3830 stop:5176 length:1347 start_codon:yes stop_codon:yes gene_type:complete